MNAFFTVAQVRAFNFVVMKKKWRFPPRPQRDCSDKPKTKFKYLGWITTLIIKRLSRCFTLTAID